MMEHLFLLEDIQPVRGGLCSTKSRRCTSKNGSVSDISISEVCLRVQVTLNDLGS